MKPRGKRANINTVIPRTITPTQRLCTSDHSRILATFSPKIRTIFSNQIMKRSHLLFESSCSTSPYFEMSNGTSVRAANKLNSMANMITPQNWRKISDTSVLVRAMGRNTITSTKVTVITVNPISLMASTVA